MTKRCFPYFEFQHPVWKWRLAELHAISQHFVSTWRLAELLWNRHLKILLENEDMLSCRQLDISTLCLKAVLRKLRRAIQDNDFPSSKNSVSEYLVTKRWFTYFEFQHLVWKWRLAELHATRYLNILFQHEDLLSCCQLDISISCWKMMTPWVCRQLGMAIS